MSKTKKVVVCVLTALIAVAVCVSFAACGVENYDDTTLTNRITALEKQVDSLNKQLNANEDSTVPVYKLGETFTYTNNGIPLFSVKVVSSGDGYVVTTKNFNMPNTPPQSIYSNKIYK